MIAGNTLVAAAAALACGPHGHCEREIAAGDDAVWLRTCGGVDALALRFDPGGAITLPP